MFLIPPAGALLLFSLLDVEDQWQNALQGSVAAAVAMVPDGLVLLTSLSFVAGVVAIARKGFKKLATVELLARVDTLCLDKQNYHYRRKWFGDVFPTWHSTIDPLLRFLDLCPLTDESDNVGSSRRNKKGTRLGDIFI